MFVACLVSYCLVISFGSPTAGTNDNPDYGDDDGKSLGVTKAQGSQRAAKVDPRDKPKKGDSKGKSKVESKEKSKDNPASDDKAQRKDRLNRSNKSKGKRDEYRNPKGDKAPKTSIEAKIMKEMKAMLDKFDLQTVELFLDEMHKWIQSRLLQQFYMPMIPECACLMKAENGSSIVLPLNMPWAIKMAEMMLARRAIPPQLRQPLDRASENRQPEGCDRNPPPYYCPDPIRPMSGVPKPTPDPKGRPIPFPKNRKGTKSPDKSLKKRKLKTDKKFSKASTSSTKRPK